MHHTFTHKINMFDDASSQIPELHQNCTKIALKLHHKFTIMYFTLLHMLIQLLTELSSKSFLLELSSALTMTSTLFKKLCVLWWT